MRIAAGIGRSDADGPGTSTPMTPGPACVPITGPTMPDDDLVARERRRRGGRGARRCRAPGRAGPRAASTGCALTLSASAASAFDRVRTLPDSSTTPSRTSTTGLIDSIDAEQRLRVADAPAALEELERVERAEEPRAVAAVDRRSSTISSSGSPSAARRAAVRHSVPRPIDTVSESMTTTGTSSPIALRRPARPASSPTGATRG